MKCLLSILTFGGSSGGPPAAEAPPAAPPAASSSTAPSAVSQLDHYHRMLYEGIVAGYIAPKAKNPPEPKKPRID